MVFKRPLEFVPGDMIKNTHLTPYSGSTITKVEDLKNGGVQVSFENSEVVNFFYNFYHEMRE